MGTGKGGEIEQERNAIVKTKLFMIMTVVATSSLMAAGKKAKVEDYGAFKGRDYRVDSNGDVVTSSGTPVYYFTRDTRENAPKKQNVLSTNKQQEMIEAAKMASSGYPDARAQDFNSEHYDGKVTGYEEVGESSCQDILSKARKNNPDSKLHIVEENGVLFISGKTKGRLNARVFKKSDGTIGIVFGGTNGFGDIIDDAKQIVPVAPTPLAYKEAAELLKAVKETYPNANINVYGHSEGGGEAMYAVLSEGVHNGTGTVKCYGVNSAGLNGQQVTDMVVGSGITKEEILENFYFIQNEKESLDKVNLPISKYAYQFGTVVIVPDYGSVYDGEHKDKDGKTLEKFRKQSGKGGEKTNLDHAHGIEETLWKMTHIPSTDNNTPDPFDSDPENDDNGQMCPVHGGGSSGGSTSGGTRRPQPPTRHRGGSGGGDTKAKLL